MMKDGFSLNALVTGAGSGIGRSTALALAGAGYNVAINGGHDLEALLSLKEEIGRLGVGCVEFLCDVSDYDGVMMMVDEIHRRLGAVNVLVNNAGISHIGLFQDMTPQEWGRVISINLTSAYNTSSIVIRDMLKAGGGSIVNVSSVWGSVGASCEVAYSASKGGLDAMTRALAKELAPSRIRVNGVACGVIDTRMNGFLADDDRDRLVDEIPMGRMGSPDEVAALIVQLAEGPEYLTGQVIRLDGGWM